MKRLFFKAILWALFALPSFAVSPPYQQWRNGPAEWLMTATERRQWDELQSDEEASRFIDLFWARRDPTLETPRNEFREEFDFRVEFADQTFARSDTRGALTDCGRVWIVLGCPDHIDLLKGDALHPDVKGRHIVWSWDEDRASNFGLDEIEVYFNTDPRGQARDIDPLQSNFLAAERGALYNWLANPDYEETPQWAMHGGLRPVRRNAVESDDAICLGPAEESVSSFTLTKDDLTQVAAEEPIIDPFATILPAATFHANECLFWAAQYYNGKEKNPELIYSLKLTCIDGTTKITQTSEPRVIAPDLIKASPGCFLLRGEITISENPPGQYELELLIADPTNGSSATLERTLCIE